MPGLDDYHAKRDFEVTGEPRGAVATSSTQHRVRRGPAEFVIQQHAARRMHWDFRLEHAGVLWSWAVPKGPSLDPHQRRLAVRTEDHPLDYAGFEGVIPAGQYGAGRVIVWDRGAWIPDGDPAVDLDEGHLRFTLEGHKLRGHWNLIRTRDAKTWLLIKSRDEFAREGPDASITETHRHSVLTQRTIDEVTSTAPPASPPTSPVTIGPVELPSIAPQLATLTDRVPADDQWLHELKLDGYRLLAYVRASPATVELRVELRTRGDEDWTAKLPELAQALAHPLLANSVIDGELCAIDPLGRSSFDRLQQAFATNNTAALVYSCFDLPVFAGRDCRDDPLIERKQALAQVLTTAKLGARVRYWSHMVGSGPEVFERACALGTEGIVSKRIDAPYESRRTRSWLKRKCPQRMTAVVGGFTRSTRRSFGALLLGSYEQTDQLRYRGKVGAGFSDADLTEILAKLEPLQTDRPAFTDPPEGPDRRGVVWVRPELRVEVVYADITEQGRLRQARFERLSASQPDPPRPVTALEARPPAIRLTHPNRTLYPALGLTKRDLANYLIGVSAWMLPQLRDRPLTMVRCPDGVDHECFYQKHAMPGLPEHVDRVPLRDSDGTEVVYASVSDPLGLVGLIQMSVIELHVWGSRVDALERPDRLVFDLDPDTDLGFPRVIEAAIEVRDRLTELGLRSFVKTTGGKGLHVVVPIAPEHEFGPIKQFCRAFALRLATDAPNRYVAVASKAQRRGKVFIDYLRNARGATSIAAYSPRARPDALVSTPLAWDELDDSLHPAQFDTHTVPARLAALARDPWTELDGLAQSIRAAASHLDVAL